MGGSPSPTPGDSHFLIGRKLGGGSGPSHQIAARLHGGEVASKPGFVVMWLNNDVADLTATCEGLCLAQLGIAPTGER